MNKKFILIFSLLVLVLVLVFGFFYPHQVGAYTAGAFVTTWKTDNAGTSDSTSITIPTTGGGYNYDVDWDNDGTFDELGITGNVTHDFGVAGTYTIQIQGTFPQIYFANIGDKEKILSVEQWGTIAWTSMRNAFYGATNLVINAVDTPDLSLVWDMSGMFRGATSFNQDISSWDVSNVIVMNSMFYGATSFNQDISSWDVSNVVDMTAMFNGATSFNQNLSLWDVSNVSAMNGMFVGVTLSISNYNAMLLAWSALSLQQFVNLNAGNSIYSSSAVSARSSIISNYSWNIIDGGLILEGIQEVSSCADFKDINDSLVSSYILTTDLDCGAEGNDIMVGTSSDPFTGTFDGGGHVIDNIQLDADGFLGLFRYIGEGGLVENLGVTNVNISDDNCDIGAVAGQNDGTISNVYSSGTISGYCEVGGLVGGHNGSDTITNSHSSANVSGSSEIGGLVGRNYSDGNIIDSYATGTVTGTSNRIGGLVGANDGTISDSYATGSVVGNDQVGGFVGTHSNGSILSSYATGSVVGNDKVGGFVGIIQPGEYIYNSYATGNVEGNANNIGGFVGFNTGDVYFSYSTGSILSTDTEANNIGGFAGYNGADSIYSSFSIGAVTSDEGANNVGGFIGFNDGYNYENSGWWTGVGQANAIGYDSDEDSSIASITYNESSIGAFKNWNHPIYSTDISLDPEDVDYIHWDFGSIWDLDTDINNGFPFFLWQNNEEESPRRIISSGSGGGSSTKKVITAPVVDSCPSGKVCEEIISKFKFLNNLGSGTISNDVKELQKYLNTHGYILTPTGLGSLGNETNKFGKFTREALIRFQQDYDITPALGFFGPITRGVVNASVNQ